MQCNGLYAGVQRWPRRLYTGMSTADVPMCADVVFVVTLRVGTPNELWNFRTKFPGTVSLKHAVTP